MFNWRQTFVSNWNFLLCFFFPFFSKVQIPPEIGNVLNMLLDVVSSISSLLNKVHHVMEKLPVFLQGIQNIGVFDISALQRVCVGFQYAKFIPLVRWLARDMCLVRRYTNRNYFLESRECREESINPRKIHLVSLKQSDNSDVLFLS